jgi:hypothetical protein
MLEINPALLQNLTELLAAAPSTEAGQSPPSKEFEQLLQGLQQVEPPESALPELMAVVTSLTSPPKDTKEKKAESPLPDSTSPNDALIALQTWLGIPQFVCTPGQPGPAKETATFCEAPEAKPEPSKEGESPKTETASKQMLNLKDFDVRRFEYKTELEIATVEPKIIRLVPLPGILQPLVKPGPAQARSAKAFGNLSEAATAATPVLERKADAPLIAAPEAVQRVRVVIDPPPPPPVARTVSIDIGDAESQVRVILRERGGQLAVQFGAATDRLRDELQTGAPGLLHELRRDETHSNVTLDFSSFGSATDAGREHPQDAQRKKQLKPAAVFADVDETAYLEENPPFSKSF